MAILICMEAIGLGSAVSPALAGEYIFNGLVYSAFLLCCAGFLLTVSTLNGELREGTLLLLFLTRVKTLDILLGKLGSIGIAGLWSLLALLPVLGIPILIGGVTGGEAFRKALALIDTLFLALSIGLWASASQDERGRSTRKAAVTLLLLLVLPLIPFSIMPRLFHGIGLFSPFILLVMARDIRYLASSAPFWFSFFLVQGLGWFFLARAACNLKRLVFSDEGGAFVEELVIKRQQRALGLVSWQPEKENSHPIEWVIYRRNSISAGLWLIATVGLAFGSCLDLSRHSRGQTGSSPFWMLAPAAGVITGLGGAVLVAWVASRFLVAARYSGALELLLTTPLGAETIVREQCKVLRRLFAWPVVLMQAAIIPQLVQGLLRTDSGIAGWQAYLALSILLSLANTFFGTDALLRLGLWFGVKARTQAAALVWTVGLGKGIPNLVSLMCSLIGAAMVETCGFSTRLPSSLMLWFLPQLFTLFFFTWLIHLTKARMPAELVGAEAPR